MLFAQVNGQNTNFCAFIPGFRIFMHGFCHFSRNKLDFLKLCCKKSQNFENLERNFFHKDSLRIANNRHDLGPINLSPFK